MIRLSLGVDWSDCAPWNDYDAAHERAAFPLVVRNCTLHGLSGGGPEQWSWMMYRAPGHGKKVTQDCYDDTKATTNIS